MTIKYQSKEFEITPTWLSKVDNLAMAKIDVSRAYPMQPAEEQTGMLVGLPLPNGEWINGAISTTARSVAASDSSVNQSALSKHWERIGLKVSPVRAGFPKVFETDLPLPLNGTGMPVITMQGHMVGVAIARADHHSTFVIPAKRVLDLVAAAR